MTELAVQQQAAPALMSLAQMMQASQFLAKSTILPKPFHGKPDDIFAAGLIGQEVGWQLMTAMMNIDIIEGRAQINAQGLVSLARQAGHLISGEIVDDPVGARVTGKRGDTGETMTVTYTVDDAVRAGYLNEHGKARSQNNKPLPWEQHTKDMCHWRASSRVCRRLFSDVYSRVVPLGLPDDADVTLEAEVEVVDEQIGLEPTDPAYIHPTLLGNPDYAGPPSRSELEAMRLAAVRYAIATNPCEQGDRPHGTGTWRHAMSAGERPVCGYCGLDPLGARKAAREREAEIVAKVGGEENVLTVGGRPAMWEAEMQADGLLTDDNRVDVDDPFGGLAACPTPGCRNNDACPEHAPF